MTQIYKHTQMGYFLFALLGAGALITLGFIFTQGSNLTLITVCVVLAACAFVFRSMTVEISDGVLAWSFGSGIFRSSVQVMDIESAKVVRNSWIYGLGIHLTLHGWLYNVGGFSAIEIKLKSGKEFRLGTDQPEEFNNAIQNARAILPARTQ
jgi:hypothetical protein